jgi:hypothetical protein
MYKMSSYIKKLSKFNSLWKLLNKEEIDKLAEALNKDCDDMLLELQTKPEHSKYHKENVEYMKRLIHPQAYDNLEDGLGYSYGEIRGWYSTLYTNDFYLSAVQLDETARFAFPKSLETFKKLIKTD